jgi:hypothetical protein
MSSFGDEDVRRMIGKSGAGHFPICALLS